MPITVSPLTKNEIRTFVQVELESFRSHPRTPMMWRNGYTDELYAYCEAYKMKSFQENPTNKFMKAVDSDTDEIVGVCEWTFALDPEANAKTELPDPNAAPPADWPPGGNWELRTYYKINLQKILREFFAGKPYICMFCSPASSYVLNGSKRNMSEETNLGLCLVLDVLTVNPHFHRKGIGAELLEWGVRQADEMGVMMGLESTPAGLALYKRFGFQEARVIKADMKLFGWDEPYDEDAARRVWMIREPQPKN